MVRSYRALVLTLAFGIGHAEIAAAGDAELQKARALQAGLDGRLSQLQALCQEWNELQPRAAKKQMRLGMYPKPDACLPEVQQYIRDQVAVMVKRAETGQDLQIPVPQWTMTMAGTDPEKLDETISKISGKVAEFRAAL